MWSTNTSIRPAATMSDRGETRFDADAVVIGGGFYGAVIASYLASERGLTRVVLLEREGALMQRASFSNQARVHNGYHYPRSFTTAYRSRVNLPRFMREWSSAVQTDFTKLYAIARKNSKVTAAQFARFCQTIGARLEVAQPSLAGLFNEKLIERTFLTEEYGFNTELLRQLVARRLEDAGVQVIFRREAAAVESVDGGLQVVVHDLDGNHGSSLLRAPHVFNCTYSGLNRIIGAHGGTQATLKHEITEMGLLQLPQHLQGLGITVMDGPFFSIMPFPARNASTVSHVRYTPHRAWLDMADRNPYTELDAYPRISRYDRMMRDVARYIPSITGAIYQDSLFEVKTVLMKNEGDDGRPILFETYAALPGYTSILGGKLDNIYDVISHLDVMPFPLHAAR